MRDPLYRRRMKQAWEIAEKTAREEYTLDWSQSKVFLVTYVCILLLPQYVAKRSVWDDSVSVKHNTFAPENYP